MIRLSTFPQTIATLLAWAKPFFNKLPYTYTNSLTTIDPLPWIHIRLSALYRRSKALRAATACIKKHFQGQSSFLSQFDERERKVHGLVDPLFVTSWHKWNRYKLHRGKSLCHGTRNGPMEVYDLCHGSRRGFFWPLLDPMEQVWFSQPACASGTSTTYANLLVPPGPSPMTNFRVIPYQKPKRS